MSQDTIADVLARKMIEKLQAHDALLSEWERGFVAAQAKVPGSQMKPSHWNTLRGILDGIEEGATPRKGNTRNSPSPETMEGFDPHD